VFQQVAPKVHAETVTAGPPKSSKSKSTFMTPSHGLTAYAETVTPTDLTRLRIIHAEAVTQTFPAVDCSGYPR
jgi:hypothetical protein